MHLQLAAVHDDERACLARRDDKCRQNRLPERGSSRENAIFMRKDGRCRPFLFGPEFPVEIHVKWLARQAFVCDFAREAPGAEESQGRFAATAR